MSGFNFEQIGGIISNLFDSDFVDIKRDIEGRLQEVYSNVPCHVAYASTDNPNPETVDIKPIIQSLNVHFPTWVDVRNNDFIIAKKMDSNGNMLSVYSGRCGNPIVSQGRKKVMLSMSATESETPTPVPPKNPIDVTVQYFSNESEIMDSIVIKIEKGSDFNLQAPSIDGYNAVNCYIDDVLQDMTVAIINDVQEEHVIKFVYEPTSISTGFRFLVNGLYTQNNGKLAKGYHLYKKIETDSITENEGVYTITCDDVNIEHEDNGKKLFVSIGTKIVLVPNEIFVRVTDILNRENGKITFNAVGFEPTQDELNAYICEWY